MHVRPDLKTLYLWSLALASSACALPGHDLPPPSPARQLTSPAPATCRADAPAGAEALASGDQAAIARLVGTYAVRIVTTDGLPAEPRTAELRLHATDSAEAFYRPAVSPQRRLAQPLTAVLSWGTDAADDGRPAGVLLRLRRGTLVRDDSRPCFDCGAMQYHIEWMADGSFGGSWSSAFDGILVEGTDGRWYSEAAGHFCAWRAAATG